MSPQRLGLTKLVLPRCQSGCQSTSQHQTGTLAVWLDPTPDLTSLDSTQANCVDAEHQPTDLAGGVRIPRGAYRKVSSLRGCLLVTLVAISVGRPTIVGGKRR